MMAQASLAAAGPSAGTMHPVLAAHVSLPSHEDQSECAICMEKEVDTLPLPCAHMQYCLACFKDHAAKLKAKGEACYCPSCRTPVAKFAVHGKGSFMLSDLGI